MAEVIQVNFEGGLNAVAAPHTLGSNEIASTTNVDYSLEWGGAFCRRGSKRIGVAANSNIVTMVGRSYNNGLDSSPWYITDSSVIERGTMTSGTITFTILGTGPLVNPPPGLITSYQNYAYIALGSKAIRDDGTNTFDWVLPKPAMPTVVNGTYTYGTFTAFNGTLTAVEGTVTGVAGSPILLNTCTTGTGTRITLTATTGGVTNWENPTVLTHPISSWDIHPVGVSTYTVGPYGIDFTSVYFLNPSAVVKISKDYSIGDTSFTNYWHTETVVSQIQNAQPDPQALLLQEQGTVSIEVQHQYADQINPVIGRRIKPGIITPGGRSASFIEDLSYTTTQWGVPRTDFQIVGSLAQPSWTSIQAVRIIVDFSSPSQMVVGGVVTYGNQFSNLTDTINGLAYFQTFARVENGVITAESTPSDAAAPLKLQNGSTQLTFPAFSGTATTGITHRIIYRQGGLLQDAYQLGSIPVASNTMEDFAFGDLTVVGNLVLNRNLWSTWPAAGVNAISEPFHERIFIGSNQNLYWSAPGAPTNIQNASQTVVSNAGDTLQAFSVWDRLIIINQNTVYEMDGTIFEGPNQDWVLKKTGARRGTAAPRTAVKTPQGVVLFGYDGISLYYPGYGIDVPLEWVYEKIGDLWRGNGTGDPAAQKGSRIPAINFSVISEACAAYGDNKLYLAVPTGTIDQQGCQTIFALDLARQKVWMYTYPFSFTSSLFWDYIQNRFISGVTAGGVYQFETGLQDMDQNGSVRPITWSITTKDWTTPTDLVLENLQLENQSPNGQIIVTALVDTNTQTLGTITSSTKQWSPLAINGTIADRINFTFSGTQTGSAQQGIYGLKWDAVPQATKVTFWRTDFDEQTNQEKIWDVHAAQIDGLGTNTITAVTFVDNVAVMTNTITSTSVGKTKSFFAFPNETYGIIAYSTYTATSPFKFYNDYNLTRPEPARVSRYVTTRDTVEEEAIWREVLAEVNPLGANLLGTFVLDNIIISTFTMTGVGREQYPLTLPKDTYGKVGYFIYNSVGGVFKHYQTWFNRTPEPSRITNYTTPRFHPGHSMFESGGGDRMEAWWHNVMIDMDCLGQPVTGTAYVNLNAISTFTLDGANGRKGYTVAFPSETYGNIIYVTYNGDGVRPFKHYETYYKYDLEPTRCLFFETDNVTVPSENFVKTWLAEVNPEGGTCTANIIIDGVTILSTNLVGNLKKTYEIGLPNITVGKTVRATYTSTTPIKHYKTDWEFEAKPFGKLEWLVTYKKLGATTQFDMARFYAVDVEGTANTLLTNTWYIDGSVIGTDTITMTLSGIGTASTGRDYIDQIPFPPGQRGFLFQQLITSTNPFRVWRSHVQIERVGVKGFSRLTLAGTPTDRASMQEDRSGEKT